MPVLIKLNPLISEVLLVSEDDISQEDSAEVNGDKMEDNPHDSFSYEDIVDKPEGESPGRGGNKYN